MEWGSKRGFLCLSALVSAALLPDTSEAAFRLAKINNATSQPVSFSIPVPTGTNDLTTRAGDNGQVILYIPARGPLVFTGVGHRSNCSRPYWAVEIKYGAQLWKYYYDGEGYIDVDISATGDVTLRPGAGSSPSAQVHSGYEIARCQE